MLVRCLDLSAKMRFPCPSTAMLQGSLSKASMAGTPAPLKPSLPVPIRALMMSVLASTVTSFQTESIAAMAGSTLPPRSSLPLPATVVTVPRASAATPLVIPPDVGVSS